MTKNVAGPVLPIHRPTECPAFSAKVGGKHGAGFLAAGQQPFDKVVRHIHDATVTVFGTCAHIHITRTPHPTTGFCLLAPVCHTAAGPVPKLLSDFSRSFLRTPSMVSFSLFHYLLGSGAYQHLQKPVLNLQGTNVVIIGGSSGMGLATAKLVKERGANVTIASRSAEKLQQAAQQIGDDRAIVADITSELSVQGIFRDLDRVDHVFISAGRMLKGKVVEANLETFRSDVDQRFWGPLYVVRNAVSKRKGSITFLTGTYASKPDVGAVVIAALMAAVEALTKGLALEADPYPCKCGCRRLD